LHPSVGLVLELDGVKVCRSLHEPLASPVHLQSGFFEHFFILLIDEQSDDAALTEATIAKTRATIKAIRAILIN